MNIDIAAKARRRRLIALASLERRQIVQPEGEDAQDSANEAAMKLHVPAIDWTTGQAIS